MVRGEKGKIPGDREERGSRQVKWRESNENKREREKGPEERVWRMKIVEFGRGSPSEKECWRFSIWQFNCFKQL